MALASISFSYHKEKEEGVEWGLSKEEEEKMRAHFNPTKFTDTLLKKFDPIFDSGLLQVFFSKLYKTEKKSRK